MDEIDLVILKELQEDARKSLNEISLNVKLSLSAVSERIRKLERSGAIAGYTAILSPEKFNKKLSCYCFLSLHDKTVKSDRQFFEFLGSEPDIVNCDCVTGQYEYIIKIVTESTKSLEKLLAKMRHDAMVRQTNTFVILSSAKNLPSIQPVSPGHKEEKKRKKSKYA